MANTGKQSPLGVNALGSLLGNTGLTINPKMTTYLGSSKTNEHYSFGSIVEDTVLRLLTWSINDGYNRGPGDGNATLSDTTYDNLISIGSGNIEALGNAKPPTFTENDPSDKWADAGYPATTGYGISGNTGSGQSASWLPYNTTNPNVAVTQWGWLRTLALQAWNEFNWNGATANQPTIDYSQFCGSFMTGVGSIDYLNKAIMSMQNSKTFLDGPYSNMDDLTSADVAGINLSSNAFGSDLEKLGKAFNLKKIDAFGLPSTLLEIIGKNSAVTQDLSLALLASGLSSTEINHFTSGTGPRPSIDQERKIYGAFLLIMGENLSAVLAPLQCQTKGLETLADLLNVKKIFPDSYASLTVPKYNGQRGLSTNSKTYYLIYQNGGINGDLTTDAMKQYVGMQIPKGAPPIADKSLSPENYVLPPTGFGSYLLGILPDDQAVAAGALQFTMRQVRNIDRVNFKRFAKAAKGIENMEGLNLVAGTSKPTSQEAIDTGFPKIALGTGPYGTYTMSDILGCVSGLPYAPNFIYDNILQLQTTKLNNIYRELLLAVEWEPAEVSVQYSTSVVGGTTYYQVTGITLTNRGGGYGRGGASKPTITLSNGGTAVVNAIGTDDTAAGSNDSGDFGRVLSVSLVSAGPAITSIPTATIQYPPTANLPISIDGSIPTSGTNTPFGTAGWPAMNSVVQLYIDQANTEIASIAASNTSIVKNLTTLWNSAGSQLLIEQRARFTNIPPVQIPYSSGVNPFPTTTSVFVDSIPTYSQDTKPHMTVQTLEAISDLNTLGGQSIVGAMRQERNQVRLQHAGITLDNNIPDELSSMDVKTLTTNGTILAGINNDINGYTNPAWLSNDLNNKTVAPIPSGRYVPADDLYIGTYISTTNTAPGDITPLLEGVVNPVVSTNVPVGPGTSDAVSTIINDIVIVQPPAQLDPDNLPTNLDPNYTNGTLLVSSPSVREAIDKVVECNCDCWLK